MKRGTGAAFIWALVLLAACAHHAHADAVPNIDGAKSDGPEYFLEVGTVTAQTAGTVEVPLYLRRVATDAKQYAHEYTDPSTVTGHLCFDPDVIAPVLHDGSPRFDESERLQTWYQKAVQTSNPSPGEVVFIIVGGVTEMTTYNSDSSLQENPFLLGVFTFDVLGDDGASTPLVLERVAMASQYASAVYSGTIDGLLTVAHVPGYRLGVTIAGQGTVALDPPDGPYPENTPVTLTPTASPGWTFDHWSGDLTGSDVPETLVMDTEKSVTAVFVPLYTLTTAARGEGTISPEPGDHTYLQHTAVTLQATPSEGWEFQHWEGGLTGSENPTSLTIESDTTVTAVFVRVFTLTTARIGGGEVFPAAGTHTYGEGTPVRLVAVAQKGWRFDRWLADLTGSQNPTTVVMDANKAIAAVFVEDVPTRHTLTTAVLGDGAIEPSAGSHAYDAGTTVLLTAWPAQGTRFDHWEGDLQGSQNPAELTIDADRSVTAVFTPAATSDVSGVVTDRRTRVPIESVEVRLTDASGDTLYDSVTTGPMGSFRIGAPSGKQLAVHFSAEGYDAHQLSGIYAPMVLPVQLVPAFPSAPVGLVATSGAAGVRLRWAPNAEPDLAGYHAYLQTSLNTFRRISDEPIPRAYFTDSAPFLEVSHTYYVTAIDNEGHESPPSETASAVPGVITLSLTSVSGEPGSLVRVPITCANALGLNPEGMDITLLFDESYVDYSQPTPVWVERTAVTRDVPFLYDASQPGVVTIAATGEADALRGEGRLFDVYLLLAPDAPLNECAVTAFESAHFYDGSGQALTVDASDTGFLCLSPVCQHGDLDDDGVVDGTDVGIALKLAVESLEPQGCELEAGDLNGDGQIDSGDALMIQRMALGLPLNPPQGSAKQDESPKADASIIIEVPKLEALPGQEVAVPITMTEAIGLSGLDMTFSYPADVLVPADDPVELSQLTQAFEIEVHADDGSLRVSMSNAVALGEAQGLLMTLKFQVAETAVSERLPLSVVHVDLKGEYGDSLGWYSEVAAKHGAILVTAPAQLADVNGDSTLNAVDIQLVINGALGQAGEHDCDVNTDGDVNAVDIQMVINAVLGL